MAPAPTPISLAAFPRVSPCVDRVAAVIFPSCNYPGDTNCNGVDDQYDCPTPILVDLAGDGFRLSDATSGVSFDLDGDGTAEQLSWTLSDSDDAWLVLDRNQNGAVDGGAELFGNYTPQPHSDAPNGFVALAVFDRAETGGNGDGWIGAADQIFTQLRLWRDENHDGESQWGELVGLVDAGVSGISIDYRESGRKDRWGNRFRYRGEVQHAKGRHVGHWAYDVVLIAAASCQAR